MKITVLDRGPLYVEGDVQLVDGKGRAFGLAGRKALALCRCGHSKNAPLCDGAHKGQGFASTCEARDLPAGK